MSRAYRNPEQMYYLISKWEQTGTTIVDFCRSQDIPKSTFGYWHKRYKEQKEGTTRSFIPVKIKEDDVPMGPTSGMTISFPNGVQVTMPSHCDVGFLRELIHIF